MQCWFLDPCNSGGKQPCGADIHSALGRLSSSLSLAGREVFFHLKSAVVDEFIMVIFRDKGNCAPTERNCSKSIFASRDRWMWEWCLLHVNPGQAGMLSRNF